MAVSSDVGDEKAGVDGEIASKEDVVQALIEKLVDPRLPRRKIDSSSPLSNEEHKSVATQMHAVVLLYNYYHRKQNRELEFVDFISFCNLAVTLRANMVSFMKWTNVCKSTEFNGAEDELSVTEKAIKDACNIAAGLDASVNDPNKGGWPITKVAVLFIDSKQENCMLEFGTITEGVWSLFEKVLDKPRINPEISSDKNSDEKRKRSFLQSLAADNELLDMGYDAVKENTGIEHHQLKMVGSYIAYSLTKEKSAAQFYIVQGPVKFEISEEVPLKYLGESLLGPLAAKSFGCWSATDIVSYYHMFPYTGFISNLLSRNNLWRPSVHGDSAQSIINVCSLKNSPAKLSVSPKQASGHIDNNSSGTIPAENNDECIFSVKDLFSEDYKRRKSINGTKGRGDEPKTLQSAPSKGQFQKTSVMKKDGKIIPETPSKGREECHCASLAAPPRHLQILVDMHNRTSQNGKVSGQSDEVGVPSDQSGTAKPVEQPCQVEPATKLLVALQDVPASDVLQNALVLLGNKRQQLFSQICSYEEMLAQYEHCIERIRDHGEVGLAEECTKSILSGNNCLMPNHEQIKKPGKIFVPGTSKCKDLENMCVSNNWRLPRYILAPSEGKYSAKVYLATEGLELNSKGGLESNPTKARESAAAQMIADICERMCENEAN